MYPLQSGRALPVIFGYASTDKYVGIRDIFFLERDALVGGFRSGEERTSMLPDLLTDSPALFTIEIIAAQDGQAALFDGRASRHNYLPPEMPTRRSMPTFVVLRLMSRDPSESGIVASY